MMVQQQNFIQGNVIENKEYYMLCTKKGGENQELASQNEKGEENSPFS
jgi:hypothetical protein